MSAKTPTQGEIHVKEFLLKLNLVQYYDRFVNEGFDQLQSLYEVTEEDLMAMNVKRGHRRLIQREIATAKGIPYSTPLLIDPSPYKEDSGALPSLVSLDMSTPSQSNQNSPGTTRQTRFNDRTMNAFFSSPYFPYTGETSSIGGSRVGGSTSSSSGSGQHGSISSGREISRARSSGVSSSTRNSSISSAEDDNVVSDTSAMHPEVPHKRKYRRHAKPDRNAPIKPPSAYVMFSNKVRAELKDQNMSFADLAKIVGDRWKAITPKEKEEYELTAAKAKEDYLNSLQNYEQTQDYKTYQHYLSEFKAKQETLGRVSGKPRKRMKTESPSSGSIADSSSNGNGNGSNGHGSNGHSSNGHSSNGHSSNGNDSNEHDGNPEHNDNPTNPMKDDGSTVGGSSTHHSTSQSPSAFTNVFDSSHSSKSSSRTPSSHQQRQQPFHSPHTTTSASSTSESVSHLPNAHQHPTPHHSLHHRSPVLSYHQLPQHHYTSTASSSASLSVKPSQSDGTSSSVANSSSQTQSTTFDGGGQKDYQHSSPQSPPQHYTDTHSEQQ